MAKKSKCDKKSDFVYMQFCALITDESMHALVDTLADVHDRTKSPIMLYLTSSGGDPHAGIHFLRMMQIYNIPLVTVAVDNVASAALFVYLAGNRRAALADATFLFHNLHVEISNGFSSDGLSKTSAQIKFVDKRLTGLLSELTGVSVRDMKKICNADRIMTAVEAQKLGIVNDIILVGRDEK